jgi:hypothetical protein
MFSLVSSKFLAMRNNLFYSVGTRVYSKILLLVKSSENISLPAYYLIMWHMKVPKKFEEIAILKTPCPILR